MSQGCTVDLISLICLAASKATINLKPCKGRSGEEPAPERSAPLGPQIPADSLFSRQRILGGQLKAFLCVVTDIHELNITPLGSLIGE